MNRRRYLREKDRVSRIDLLQHDGLVVVLIDPRSDDQSMVNVDNYPAFIEDVFVNIIFTSTT